jgi:hypothetical protein
MNIVVARTAYLTARTMGVSDKVLLALFEAGLVESNMENLDHGDSTSLGFLQQKPEYWGGKSAVMNVETATTSFVNKAKQIENNYKTAGQLAQAVQRSAFPLRYDAAEEKAKALIKQVSSGEAKVDTDNLNKVSNEVSPTDFVTDPVGAINKTIVNMVTKVFNPFVEFMTKLNIYAFIVILIIVALAIVYGQEQIKKAGKTAVKAGKAYVTGGTSLVAEGVTK